MFLHCAAGESKYHSGHHPTPTHRGLVTSGRSLFSSILCGTIAPTTPALVPKPSAPTNPVSPPSDDTFPQQRVLCAGGRVGRSAAVLVDVIAEEQADVSVLWVALSTGLKYQVDRRPTRTQSSRIGLGNRVDENAALRGLPVGARGPPIVVLR